MKAIKYSDKYYLYKGFFKEDIFKDILKKGVQYKNYRFYIPIELKDYFIKTYNIEFTDDVLSCLYFSYNIVNEELKDDIMINLSDINGGYIYINSSDKKIDNITPISKLPYFVNNLFEVRGLNIKTDKPFYLVDYLVNTDIGIEISNDIRDYFYNKNSTNTLYLHQIINRICLQKVSCSE